MTKKEFKFENGDKVKDKITGFVGTVTASTYYISGNTSYLVESKVDTPQNISRSGWFDENRLVFIM